METWKIVLICYCAICYFFAILSFINEYTERRKYGTQRQIELSMYMACIFAPITIILLLSDALFGDYIRKAKEIYEHGGVKKYREWKKLEEQKRQEEQERLEEERIESERIKAAFLAGEIQRNELPRLDGVNEFIVNHLTISLSEIKTFVFFTCTSLCIYLTSVKN